MKEKQQKSTDRHLGTPADANQDHHINFRKVEEESASTLVDFHNTDTKRQRQWKEELEEGHKLCEQENDGREATSHKSHDDDTLGQQ